MPVYLDNSSEVLTTHFLAEEKEIDMLSTSLFLAVDVVAVAAVVAAAAVAATAVVAAAAVASGNEIWVCQ